MATIVADDALAEAAGAPIDVDILEINKIAYKIATKVLYYGLNFSNYTHTSCSPQESR